MAYGAKIYNSAGGVVIDDSEPSYLLSNGFTMSGTDIGNGRFQYPYSSMQDASRPTFVNLEVGDFLGAGFAGYLSFKSSLTFLSLKPANQLPDPSGYDVVFYNPQGQKTWIASLSVAVLNSFFVIPFLQTITSDADHVALLSSLPFFAPTSQDLRANVVCGVQRTSPTTYQWAGASTGVSPVLPEGVGPFPVSALFAKSN